MSLGAVLVILAVVLLIGAFPAWPYSRRWGYMPTSVLGGLLLLLVVLLVLGRI